MKRKIRTFFRRFGYDIVKFKKGQMGIHPFYDMAKFVKSDQPMLFDVGANVGQTIKDFKEVFKHCTIHAFEPSPDTFGILKRNTNSIKHLHLWNYGVGAKRGELLLNEYDHSNTNSFLNIAIESKNPIKQTPVDIITVDAFCDTNSITKIDVLKIDTEGFELEVLKGASSLLSNNSIGLLFLEVSFANTYQGMPSFTELYNFVLKQGFDLVSIYPISYRNNMAVYTNILFKHTSY